MKLFQTIISGLLAVVLITAAVFLTIDGNLSRLTGWYRVTPGMPLFTNEHVAELKNVCWIRLKEPDDIIECVKEEDGTWWIVHPFRDKLNPEVIDRLLMYAASATIVDTLEMDKAMEKNMRDFGFESDYCEVTMKVPGGSDLTTAARFTLGKPAPWVDVTEDGKENATTYLRTNFYGSDDRVHVVSGKDDASAGNITSLFASGVKNLRDPAPIRFNPDTLTEISLTTTGQPTLKLNRKITDLEKKLYTPWMLTQYNSTMADQESVAKLIVMLSGLNAAIVQDAADVTLPEEPTHIIELKSADSETTKVLRLYAPFTEHAERGTFTGTAGSHCYATVDGRNVVFTLPAERQKRRGCFADYVNGVYSLPLLPAQEMADLRHLNEMYTAEMPLTIGQLRSLKLPMFGERDVKEIRLSQNSTKLSLVMTPGVKESNTQDSWTVHYKAPRKEEVALEAETDIVRALLRAFRLVPAEEIVTDLPAITDKDEQQRAKRKQLIAQYGLNAPTMWIDIKPRECAFRANLFGINGGLPLVKDRQEKTFIIKYNESQDGKEATRYAMEADGNTIYRISPKLNKLLSLNPTFWKARNILTFHISELKSYTIEIAAEESISSTFKYNHDLESWSGSYRGCDITKSLVPHKAMGCIDRMRKLKVRKWISRDEDEDSWEAATLALENPDCRFIINLEIEELPEADIIMADISEYGHDNMSSEGEYRSSTAEEALIGNADLDAKFRQQISSEKSKKQVCYTIEFAPTDRQKRNPIFYGRIKETGEIFELSFQDGVSMGQMPIEPSLMKQIDKEIKEQSK